MTTEAQPLTTFKITYTNGQYYYTNCAAGITLAEATAYFTQLPHTYETPSGKEFKLYVATVEEVK